MTGWQEIKNAAIDVVDESQSSAETWAQAAQNSLDTLATNSATLVDLSGIEYSATGLSAYSFTAATAPDDPTFDTAPEVPVLTTPDSPDSWSLDTQPTEPTLSTTPDPIADAVLSAVPELAALTLPTIDELLPVDSLDYLTHTYSYTEPEYTAKVSTEIEALLDTVFAGGLVTPVSLWEDIWDRAVGEIEKASVGDEWAASELAASLGMTGLPSETFLSRLSIAEQRKAQNISKVRLEQSVQEAQQRREDMWQSITQGLAYEGLWIQFHNEVAGRALASAVNAYQAKVAIYNANVAVFNAKIQYAAQAIAINQLELQVALAPLQYYAQQLDALRVEVLQDEQKVKRWLGEWQGYQTETQAKVTLFQSKINMWTSDWQGKKGRQDGQISAAQFTIQENDQRLALFRTLWEGINIESQATVNTMRANLDKAKLQLENEQVRLGYLEGNDKQQLEVALREPAVAVDKARLQIEQTLGTMEKIAQLQIGLAQAYLSAIDASINANANVSDNFNYAGTI